MNREGIEFNLTQSRTRLVEMAIPNRKHRHGRENAIESDGFSGSSSSTAD